MLGQAILEMSLAGNSIKYPQKTTADSEKSQNYEFELDKLKRIIVFGKDPRELEPRATFQMGCQRLRDLGSVCLTYGQKLVYTLCCS